QYVSSFLNVSSSTPPSSSPRCSAIAPARSGCERPAKTIRRFCGPRSIQCPGDDSVMDAFSSPGRASSAVSVTLSMLLVDPAFLGLLARPEPAARGEADVMGGMAERDEAAGDWRRAASEFVTCKEFLS